MRTDCFKKYSVCVCCSAFCFSWYLYCIPRKIGAPLADIKVKTLDGIGTTKGKETETNIEKETKGDATVTNEVKEGKSRCDTVPSQRKGKGKLNASPAVRALAFENQVNVEDVIGTGKNGIITKQDILEYVKNKNKLVQQSKETGTPLVQTTKEPVKEESKASKDSRQGVEKEEVLLTSPISKGMIKSMNQSLSVPYMSLQEDIDITELLRNRTLLNNFLKSQNAQEKLTVTTFIVKALSKALQMVPILNSKFDTVKADRYMLYHSHNISIAIDTPYGLVVPNIKNVQNLSLQQIQRELTELGTLAKNNRLSMNHLTGGTITLSNVGVIGGTAVRPIVFDGQACIVGLGRTQKLPRFDASSKNIECRDIMNLTASVDHRHIDGATVARFIKMYVSPTVSFVTRFFCFRLREILQDPTLLSL
jgi:2-oxoisovalerate dehydrogenase E2 component (dihydrolipoyl transacylase)